VGGEEHLAGEEVGVVAEVDLDALTGGFATTRRRSSPRVRT